MCVCVCVMSTLNTGECCDNWRGISLLEVVGKVLARIVKERANAPRVAVGKKGRGCCDMIFVARQLFEKTREHVDTLFTLFVDLWKASDSVPKQAFWQVLEKSGASPRMLNIIKSFHEGMRAEVRVEDSRSGSFQVRNGLWQECTLAPTLFSIYFGAVVANWHEECSEGGVDVLFNTGGSWWEREQQS